MHDPLDRGTKFVLADGTRAPRLWLTFECPQCHHVAVLDAFDGPPRCFGKVGTDDAHAPTFMVTQIS